MLSLYFLKYGLTGVEVYTHIHAQQMYMHAYIHIVLIIRILRYIHTNVYANTYSYISNIHCMLIKLSCHQLHSDGILSVLYDSNIKNYNI